MSERYGSFIELRKASDSNLPPISNMVSPGYIDRSHNFSH